MLTKNTQIAERANQIIAQSRQKTQAIAPQTAKEDETNAGGLLGGVGYVLESLGLGIVSGVEGATDFVVGGLAKLFGADDWAEDIFADEWLDYNHANEWYNPEGAMKVVGDVTHSIGAMAPSIAAMIGTTIATGGTAAAAWAPYAASLGTTFLSSSGRGVSQAYDETGKLGGEEFAYGIGSGALETGVEAVSMGLGLGSTARIAKKAGQSVAKNVAKEATEYTLKHTVKEIAKDAGSEAVEEAVTAYLEPYVKRATIDPNAKNASADEILYAALLGGLSGTVMTGSTVAFDSGTSLRRGNKIVTQGKTEGILSQARQISAESEEGIKAYETTRETLKALESTLEATGGKIETTQQKMLLGTLQQNVAAARLSDVVAQSAQRLIENPEATVARFNAFGATDADGNKVSITVDELLSGVDRSDLSTKNGVKAYRKSIRKALMEDSILSRLAVLDATNNLAFDTQKIQQSILKGERLATKVDINNLLTKGSQAEIKALSDFMGVDDISKVAVEDIQARVRDITASGGMSKAARQAHRVVEANKISPVDASRTIPRVFKKNMADGTYRFADGNANIAVIKEGEKFFIYDYNTNDESREMTSAEMNRALKEIRTKSDEINTKRDEMLSKAAEIAKQDAEIDKYARENVKGYSALSAPNRDMIRKVIREGRAAGLTDAEVTSYARVATRAGVDIDFNSMLKDGEAGYFDPEGNRIVVNPKTTKKHELLLIHELDHAIRSFVGGDGKVRYLLYKGAEQRLSKETREMIRKKYADQDVDVSREALMADEASAYYSEAILGGKGFVDMLLGEEATLKDKILAFFKGAAKIYSEDAALTREANAHYRRFKKMFDAYANINKGRNANAGASRIQGERKSFSSIAQTFYGNPTMSVREFLKGNYREQIGYKKYVEQCLNNYKQTRPYLDEVEARKEIEANISGIVEVAVAAKNAGYDIFDEAAKRDVRDSKQRLLFSSLEPNSDYFTSSDISTICDKRINFAEIYDEIVRREEALGVPKDKRFFNNVDNYFYIHKVLADKGLTQPCRECYVESMRKNLAPMAKSFLELINEPDADNKSNKLLWVNGKLKENNAKLRERVRDVLINEYESDPSQLTIEDVSTEEGLAALKITKPLVYEAFNSFYGQAKPKMPRSATPFRFGELTALLTDNKGKINKGLVQRINKTGGFRLQSYSDFQIQNFVDVLQTIFEAGSLGLTGHAYTKVPAFLDATEGTNLKRNISIFMYRDGNAWKIDKNDSFPMSLEEIEKIVKADKSGNTGIIAVSQNAEMSAWIMANDGIAYGIPFHKSGLKMATVRDTIVKEDGREIKGYAGTKDHTKQQTEVWKRDQRNEKGEIIHKKGTKVKEGISIYDGFWDFENKDNLSQRDLIRKNLEAYIDECEKRDYIPRFREYLVDNSKVLEDILGYAKELGYADANATVEDISFKYKGYTVPYGYYKFLGDYAMFTADGKAAPAKVLSLNNYDFKKAVKYFSDAESLRREEILRQFANGTEREKYRNTTMTAGELENIVKQKRDEVVREVVEKSVRSAKEITPEIASPQNIAWINVDYNDSAAKAKIVADLHKRMVDSGLIVKIPKEISLKVKKSYPNLQGMKKKERLPILKESIKQLKNSLRTFLTQFKENTFEFKVEGNILEAKLYNVGIDEVLEKVTQDKAEMLYTSEEIFKNSQYLYSTPDNEGDPNIYRWNYFYTPVEISGNVVGVRIAIRDMVNPQESQIYNWSIKKDTSLDGIGRGTDNRSSYGISSDVSYNPIISQPSKSVNRESQKSQRKSTSHEAKLEPKKTALPDLSKISGAISMDTTDPYEESMTKKEKVQEATFSGWTSFKIATTNSQAGIEAVAKRLGIGGVDKAIQSVRASRAQADSMLMNKQLRIGKQEDFAKMLKEEGAQAAYDGLYQGEGLEPILRPIHSKGEETERLFFYYLETKLNTDRMTLDKRSRERNEERRATVLKNTKRIKELNEKITKLREDIKALGRAKKNQTAKAKLKEELEALKSEAKTLNKDTKALAEVTYNFVPLENKAVLADIDEKGERLVDDEGDDIAMSAEKSEELAAQIEKEHPEFIETAEKLWAFLRNVNQYRVDTGLISQELFDELAWRYPHYIPSYRVDTTKGIGAVKGKYNLEVKPTISTAKGSTADIQRPDVIIARQVEETIKAGRVNQLARLLHDGAERRQGQKYIEIISRKKVSAEDVAEIDPDDLRPKNNEISFYKDGERITMRVAKEVFAGFEAFSPNPSPIFDNVVMNTLAKANRAFKALITSANPAFLVRNAIRDVQDAGINSKYASKFAKNYARAQSLIRSNSPLWNLYLSMGGFSSSLFDFERGFQETNSGTRRQLNKWGLTKAEGKFFGPLLQKIENANAFTEQLPRFAEFISSIETGNTPEQAILDAADVTTNFGRSGALVQQLNRTVIPFLNPAIQGFSKTVRVITGVRTSKEIASLLARIAIIGIIPMAFNAFMYDDDEDYENLRLNDKENNFLFKIGDTFVKIPRGRVASVFGGLYNRSKTALEGKDADWAGYLENAAQQASPVDSISRTIFSPFTDVATNTTWYGTAIEGRHFESVAPKDRYDEGTSSIAIAIGQVIGYSPKKIHYLLDQYSGVIGDFVLPMTTNKAEKDFIRGNFTLDPATSNKLSANFYEIYDQTRYAKSAGDDTAIYQLKYLNKVKDAIGEMNDKKKAIQSDATLSNAEKLQQTRVVQILINEAYKTATNDYELYTKAIEATAGIEDEKIRFTEATRLMYGAERALSEYNDDVYAKSLLLNKAGVSFDDFYSYYFTVRDIESDVDRQGNVIEGSRRNKVIKAINGLKISTEKKLMLIAVSGYSLKDGDIKGLSGTNAKKKLLKYITRAKGTAAERAELAKACGFEVKNNRIITK